MAGECVDIGNVWGPNIEALKGRNLAGFLDGGFLGKFFWGKFFLGRILR